MPTENAPALYDVMNNLTIDAGIDATAPPPRLKSLVAAYEAPSLAESTLQVASSVLLLILGWAAMYLSLGISYWLTLALAVPVSGLLVRVFIIQHDCGHGSLFKSRRANDWVGRLCSLATLTPYANWRRQHSCHHGHWNNLDRRDAGADIYSACATVAEYRAMTPWGRFTYRFVRHPILAHFLIPPTVFLLLYRVPFDTPKTWRAERRSVHLTNLGIVALYGSLAYFLGLGHVLMVQLPINIGAAIVGVWLFAIQHRFDGTIWTRQEDWTFSAAALNGSSYLKLPRVFQWFTGNIGFHHIHHLNPRVPNYRLQACHDGNAALQTVRTLNWRDGLRMTGLVLWDEENKRMVKFDEAAAN